MVEHHIAFRTDASSQIGTGHFMRCLTLADSLNGRGTRIRFISRHLPDHLRSILVVKGHELVLLDSVQNELALDELGHARWLGVSQTQDAVDSIRALSDGHWDWLIVDHYALDSRWETMLRRTVKRLLVVDDIADREHDCDVLLDQNLYTDTKTRYTSKVPLHCKLLLGPRYALLRDEFKRLHDKIKPRSGPVRRVLVFYGGVDEDNYTGRTIELLFDINIRNLHVDVVIGAQHPCCEQIKSQCTQHGYVCYVQTDKMAELMATADLAIGAGGSASWERCCLGLPALLIALADNQINIAKALDVFGACIYVGRSGTTCIQDLRNAFCDLLNNPDRLKVLSDTAYSLVDGMGVDRVCQETGF
ncbi:MAG: UDP-2,4-diacetamido-2,4,6-trideoxy-beta-L-altropyranose hydrolase [Gammaproteobacteria bacterium]|nr:MAG: UDP-2,4-diacetamido-2,4,6-trideoxy-beta-L-altropyranose hydrolase [Gammaproteobacteria bacterium]